MSNTKDNNKKEKDNQAYNTEKNLAYEKNRKAGRHSFSKETNHK